jgi:hypothetical protein
MVEDLMAAPLRSPLHSPLRSSLRSPFSSRWGEPQVRLSSMTINETAADNAVVGALTVVNLPAGITASSYAITADPDNKFAIVSTDLTIDEDVDYSTDPSHSVTIEATLSDASTLSRTFTISVLDTAAPTLSSSTPADNATGVAVNASPALVFSENIFFNYPGGGTFTLKLVGGATVETFTPTSTSAATGSAGGTASITTTTLTINPFANLAASTAHCIRVAADCLEDDAGNAYAGITDDTTLSFTSGTDGWAGIDFTTGSVPVTVTATGGTNGTRVNSSGVVVAGSAGRLTYNIVSPFASHGIENEPARTNLCLENESLDSPWGATGRSANTPPTTTAPDGGDAEGYIENAANSVHELYQGVTITTAPTTWSVYAKPTGRDWVYINAYDGGNNFTYFDVTNGTVGTNAAGNTSTIEGPDSRGFYRCIVTRTAAGTSGFIVVGLASADATLSYQGDDTSGAYFWGGQVETGGYATSVILTAGSSVTRAADVLKYTPPAGVTDVRYTYQDNTTADAAVTPEVEVTITNTALAIKTITDIS